jgi:hypothetical protein
VQAAGLDALGHGLGLIRRDILETRVAVLESRAWKEPVQVGMRDSRAEPALRAGTARIRTGILAEEKLTEPDGQPLLTDTTRSLEQETRRQRAPGDGGAQLLTQAEMAL